MTERYSPSEIPREMLRDQATAARLERVWRRIEGDLERRTLAQGRRRLESVPRWVLVAPAAALLLFFSGVLVGSRLTADSMPAVILANERAGGGEAALMPRVATTASASQQRAEERGLLRSRRSKRPRPPVAALPAEPPARAAEIAPLPVPVAVPDWYLLWREDEYQRAREALERDGGFEAVLERASAEQTMAMVDLARFSHENALAIAALRSVVDRFPDDPNAPFAALTLGNLLDRAGDAKGAAAAFSAYRTLSPDGDFAEDALARQLEAALREGDTPRARELLAQYEKQYPTGKRLEELRAEVAAVLAAAGSEGEGGPELEGPRPAEPGAGPERGEWGAGAVPSGDPGR